MMKTKRLLSFLTLLAVGLGLFFLPARLARADSGPKPSMDFKFVYDISPALTIVSGALYECSDPDCSDAAPLGQMGPQGFSCDAESCSSMAYGYSDYHRLSIRSRMARSVKAMFSPVSIIWPAIRFMSAKVTCWLKRRAGVAGRSCNFFSLQGEFSGS